MSRMDDNVLWMDGLYCSIGCECIYTYIVGASILKYCDCKCLRRPGIKRAIHIVENTLNCTVGDYFVTQYSFLRDSFIGISLVKADVFLALWLNRTVFVTTGDYYPTPTAPQLWVPNRFQAVSAYRSSLGEGSEPICISHIF